MFGHKKKDSFKQKNVRLVVTGVCKESEQENLRQKLEKQGVKAVVTSVPVLGLYDT